jgi:hypothetical protein
MAQHLSLVEELKTQAIKESFKADFAQIYKTLASTDIDDDFSR